jgi:hypothetical protein
MAGGTRDRGHRLEQLVPVIDVDQGDELVNEAKTRCAVCGSGWSSSCFVVGQSWYNTPRRHSTLDYLSPAAHGARITQTSDYVR